MSSRQEHDEIDYFEDTSHNEDETLFIPVPDSTPDSWTAFYSGILIGIAGGGLASLAPWLSGLLIFGGYALTAFSLKRTGNRFVRALRFGFGIAALSGAALLAAEILASKAAWQMIVMAGDRSLLFITIAGMPWVVGLLRYGFALIRNEKRYPQARPA